MTTLVHKGAFGMFAALVSELRTLGLQDRIARAGAELSGGWTDEQRATLVLFMAHSARKLGRRSEALRWIRDAEKLKISGPQLSRLLEIQALIEMDRGDVTSASATLARMERLGIEEKAMPEYYGLRARAVYPHDPESAWPLFELAYQAQLANNKPQGAKAVAMQACRRALDSERFDLAQAWLSKAPVTDPYRMIFEIDLAWRRRGDIPSEPLRRLQSDPSADNHVRARALIIEAESLLQSNSDRASHLAERALTLATQDRNGYEDTLVQRIQAVISETRKEGANA